MHPEWEDDGDELSGRSAVTGLTSGADPSSARRHVPGQLARNSGKVLMAVAIGTATVAVPPLIVHRAHSQRPAQSPPLSSTGPARPSTTSDPAETLLSRGRPATASSTESAATPASAAVDGNAGTRWSSAFSDPQWLQIDLGFTATITRVTLRWETSYATGYRIQTSADGDTWTDIYRTVTSTGGTQSLTVAGHGRFVRMYGTARSTQWGYSLWEFEVYGTGAPIGCDTGTDAALNRPATASSVQDGSYVASNAVDGDLATRWSSAARDPQWIEVDLGSSRNICEVVLAWESAFATAYQIQTSADGRAWTSIYRTTTAAGGTQTISVAGTGRYLRIYGTARATGWGYSLWELTVHTRGS
jgi:hypothetical protein